MLNAWNISSDGDRSLAMLYKRQVNNTWTRWHQTCRNGLDCLRHHMRKIRRIDVRGLQRCASACERHYISNRYLLPQVTSGFSAGLAVPGRWRHQDRRYLHDARDHDLRYNTHRLCHLHRLQGQTHRNHTHHIHLTTHPHRTHQHHQLSGVCLHHRNGNGQ
jgi:hypothetical protein